MENKVSNISFTSDIRFVTQNTYKRLINQSNVVKVSLMYRLNHVASFNKKGASEGISSCIGGINRNLSDNITDVFHWDSCAFANVGYVEQLENQEITDALSILAKLKKIKGLLIGGVASPHEDFPFSLKMVNFLKLPLKKTKKADFSMFLFQKKYKSKLINYPESAFLYDKEKDTYYINCTETKRLKANTYKRRDIMNRHKIRDHYGVIKISDNDKVFVGLKSKIPIANKFWNKNDIVKKENKLY